MRAKFFVYCLLFSLFLLPLNPLLGQAADLALSEERQGLGEDFLQRAQRLQFLGYYSEALKNYDLAIEQAKGGQLRDEMLEAIEGKGITLWNLGRMKEAADWLSQGAFLAKEWRKTVYQRFFDTCLIIYDLYQKGKERREKLDYEGAINCFQRAINLAAEFRYREFELKCLRQASLVYFDQNELSQFYRLNERALRIARLLNHKLEEARCLNNIALYQLKEGDFIKAGIKFNEALSVAMKLDILNDIADILHNLGLVVVHLGFFDRAISYFKEALTLDKKQNDFKKIVLDLNHIGLCFRSKGKLMRDQTYIDESIKFFEEGLELANKYNIIKGKILSLNNLAISYSLLGKKDEAINYLENSIKLCKETRDVFSLLIVTASLATVYLDENPKLALELLEGTLRNLTKIVDNNLGVSIYYHLGQGYEKLNQLKKAIESYDMAIKEIEKTRRQIGYDFYQAGFLRSKAEVFDAVVRVRKKLYEQEPNEQNQENLLLAIERAKARSFLEAIANSDSSPEMGILLEKEKQLRRDLAQDTLTISSLRQVGDKKERTVDEFTYIRKEDSYLALVASKKQQEGKRQELMPRQVATKNEVQRELLDERTAVIEFYLADWGSIALLITTDALRYFFLPEKRLIEDSVTGYIKLISNPPMAKITGELAAKRLYHELFEPMEKYFPPAVENLIIIPDGYLHYLPFESLIYPENKKEKSQNYLIKKYNISYAPSISSLLYLKKKPRNQEKRKEILAVGAPDYKLFLQDKLRAEEEIYEENLRDVFFQQDFRFSSLPFARKEIKKVAAKFPRKSRVVFTGPQARESNLKNLNLEEFRIIHFACHSFVDESFPFRSALLLTPEPQNGEDGFLQAHEISILRLNADLVVLSACQSAKGPIEKSEGILGINRVFFTSGARSVLSSIWKINDQSTAQLMGIFYDYLKRGWKITQALRAAKLEMLESKFSHPFYWAGFIFSGDGSGALY